MEFRILGPLEAFDEGREVPLGAAKERAVLAVLLLHAGTVVSRTKLIDALWGDAPPPTAAKALNVYVSQVRKTLSRNGAEAIATRPPGYLFAADGDTLDSTRFQRLATTARERERAGELEAAATLMEEALELWRGPALAGVELEGEGRDDVARLEELRLAAQLDLIDYELALGRHEQLLAELEPLVAQHPLDERLRGQLILALYRSGRQADALQAFRETRETLVETLGLEPSAPLQRLERAILNHDPSLEAPAGMAEVHGAPPRMRGVNRSTAAGIVTLVAVAAAGAVALWVLRSGDTATEPLRPARAAVAHVVANSVVRLDPRTGKVGSVIPVGETPVSMATAPTALWIANRGDGTVTRYDLRTHELRKIGGVPFANDVAVDKGGGAWVSSARRPIVTRLEPNAPAFPDQPEAPEAVKVPSYAGAEAVGGGFLWVGNAGGSALFEPNRAVGADLVSLIDLKTHRLVSSIRLGRTPTAIAFGFGSAWIGAFDQESSTEWLGVIRAGSNDVEWIRLASLASWGVHDIAVGAGGVWALTWSGTLVRIDPETRRIRARIPIGSNKEPLGVAVGAGSVWVTNRADLSVSQVDPRLNRIVRTIPLGTVGAVPCGVAVTADALWITIGPDTDCASPQSR